MLVLVASGDQNHRVPEVEPTTIAGELVIPIESCTCDTLCRCRRSWFGIASGGVTPTAVVAERAGVEPAELRRFVAMHLKRKTADDENYRVVDTDVAAEVEAVLEQLEAITQQFPDGAELTRVGDHVTAVGASQFRSAG